MDTLPVSSAKKVPCLVWCLVWNALLFIDWFAATPRLFNSYNSPRCVYRLEIHDASLLQRAIHYDQKIPSLVRLYHVNSRALLRGLSRVCVRGVTR
ncbi:hypothetical protein [Acidovorax sp. SUPP3334]|uniref:hypothetical protein n=1 Tax=Acidovorax sp. SUPP3334 TaxID=2920881 RepID=UPI0023DE5826|nr:hypothetical protein [Acidovorax sp. SUPP3334]GKT20488.1 hypothetical protein AVHM3334_01180 [Acidovorax sp. SUPP3334]